MLIPIVFSSVILAAATPGVDEPKALDSVAREVFELELPAQPAKTTDHNLVALSGAGLTVSRRVDSRTYFVRNVEYGPSNDGGAFDGPDERLRETTRRIFAGLRIDERELVNPRVREVVTAVGEYDETADEVKGEVVEARHKVLVGTRSVDSIPVFSSRLYLGLTKAGAIGRLKLHWPVIPPAVVADARRYRELVKGGFKPPIEGRERVTSIEAGIVHSSPHGRQLKVLPAIRVVYAASEGGGKPRVRYLDAAGRPLRLPHDEHSAPTREKHPVGQASK